jgi:hypothetical protein
MIAGAGITEATIEVTIEVTTMAVATVAGKSL